MIQILILYRFTSLNDYIEAERTNRNIAAKIKRQETEIARYAALSTEPVDKYPVSIVCYWYRKDQRTDPDNVAFAIKFILDGFIKAQLLKGDGWKYIKEINHKFILDDNDYVIVDIV